MDEVVRQAMSRWPNVPHCFGWLRLDARGHWCMRDERAQQLGLAGERITHPALLAFITRNYAHDEQGRWFFQNGPQRVYVELALTPYIARFIPDGDDRPGILQLHTGADLPLPDTVWMDRDGRLYLQDQNVIAAVDDRDLVHLLPQLQVSDQTDDTDMALMRWLEAADDAAGNLIWTYANRTWQVHRIDAGEIAQRLGFVATPEAD